MLNDEGRLAVYDERVSKIEQLLKQKKPSRCAICTNIYAVPHAIVHALSRVICPPLFIVQHSKPYAN